MARKTFQSEKALSGLAPLSTLTEHNGTVYLSGVTAIDPKTGALHGGASEQAVKALGIICDILADYGMSEADVLKATIYLTDMADFPAVNQAYQSCFSAPYPARTCIQAAKLPAGALVEIDIIAGK